MRAYGPPAVRTLEARLFPIPMRGNELPVALLPALAEMFPIPMRGNET